MALLSRPLKITVLENQDFYKDKLKLDEIKQYEIDFTPWAEDHDNIVTITWTLKFGQVGVSSETLNSNIATAILSFGQRGRNLVEIKAETSIETKIVWLDLFVTDLSRRFINDYDLGC